MPLLGSWNSETLGEFASLGAALAWSCSISLYAKFGKTVSAVGLNFFKNLVAFLSLTVAGCWLGWHFPQQVSVYLALALSGLIGLAIGDNLFLIGLKSLGLQRTSALQCLAPIFAALLSLALFQESLSFGQWSGLLATTGALAVLVLWRQGAHTPAELDPKKISLGLLAALGAASCQAVTVTILRHYIQGMDVVTGTYLRVLPAVLVLSTWIFHSQGLAPLSSILKPATRGWTLGFAAFLGTFVGLILMSLGAKYAKAGVSSAITSTYPMWILFIAHFMLGEKVQRRQWLLTATAVGGVATMMLAS